MKKHAHGWLFVVRLLDLDASYFACLIGRSPRLAPLECAGAGFDDGFKRSEGSSKAN